MYMWILWTLPLLLMFVLLWNIWFYKKPAKIKSFSENWIAILNDKVGYYARLTDAEKRRFEKEILHFFNTVSITGVKVDITDTDRLLVASSAVIPLFGFPELRYRNINEVLLYKDAFNADHQFEGKERNILGKVGSGDMNRLMILSLPALRAGFSQEHSKSNVGIHEFVHLIDMADGAVDGLPESLLQQQYVMPWLNAMHEEIEDIKQRESDINPYGATSKIEFFSVASEYFFNQPKKFKKNHPDLYAVLAKIYAQEL